MRNRLAISGVAAAALAFLQMGANHQALDTVAPRDKFSSRQRKKRKTCGGSEYDR